MDTAPPRTSSSGRTVNERISSSTPAARRNENTIAMAMPESSADFVKSLQQFLPSLGLLILSVGVLVISLRKRGISKAGCRCESNGPTIYPIVGMLFPFLKNRHRYLEWFTDVLAASPSNTVKFQRPGGVRGVITANPANVEHILRTSFENYPKGKRFQFLLKDFLGNGIFNADGELWKMQRKVASYEFNTKSLRSFVVETVQWEILHRLVPVLSTACQRGRCVDLQDVLQRFAFDNICKVAFGADPACLHPSLPTSKFAQAFDDATRISSARFLYPIPFLWRVKRFLNVGSERRLRQAIGTVDEFAMDIIHCRRKELLETRCDEKSGVRQDLLSRFMSVMIDSQEEVDELFLKDMVVSFMLAGRDTTSSALAWFFWLLSSRPQVEERIHIEILGVLGNRKEEDKGINVFGYEELKEMHYLHAALCESMKLYPPVPVDSKIARCDDVLPDGTFVGKGWFVTYHVFAMGRMEGVWGSDCLEFKPERWLKDGVFVGENPFKFPVFQAGPRICLGKEMAFIQMKSIVASIIHGFTLQVDPLYSPKYTLSLTMPIKGGLPVTVKRR